MNEQQDIQKEQKRIHNLVSKKFSDYYLTGGTALAFYYDHRFSEDLDFFSQKYNSRNTEKIMQMISKTTGYEHKLVFEQKDSKFLPLRMYELELKKGMKLKVDMVQDPYQNIEPIKNGMHSVEDIYYRKVQIALNPLHVKKDDTGRNVSRGRQQAKDIYDIYYLSENYKNLGEFYLEHFPPQYFHRLNSWYRSLDKMDMIFDLKDMILHADPKKVFRELDEQIIRQLSHHPAIQRQE